MDNLEQLKKLAKKVVDGNATEEEKLQTLKELNNLIEKYNLVIRKDLDRKD